MANSKDQAQSLFLNALEIATDSEREAYVSAECGDDRELRREVEELLDHAKRLGRFLDPGGEVASPTIDQPITEKPDAQIGPYKLLQQIGEGGMGVVYMAEQKEPVKRRVALKIIKPGMDTRQVIARFEAERQALAMMDHPNIAKVLDAGATESGRPYFVMELVNGLPVTKYCDEQHLTPKERLELFVPICQAVQHAHQKGIIHRDLKPSNILVALYDGQAVPKIIDFGVAKATSQTLTEKTMFTQLGQVVGTLEYMSPEQAERNQLDIDTRSDIYSLGVVLYELLTGETPFDRERLRTAAFEEMLRIIREEEPCKPSTKVSSSLSLPSIAANRRTAPAKLTTTIRGELDWIVMKALEKDRARRYESAGRFAEDVRHHLLDEPVQACPPSWRYRLGKFASRNAAAIGLTSLISLTLVSLAVSWLVLSASARRQERERQVVNARLRDALWALHTATDAAEQAGLSHKDSWAIAWQAFQRAEALTENTSADAEIVAQVRVAGQHLDQRRRDRELIARLERIRLMTADTIIEESRFNLESALPQYDQVFAEERIHPRSVPPKEIVQRLAARHSTVRQALLSALLDWRTKLARSENEIHSIVAQVMPADLDRLLETVAESDLDPWFTRIRKAESTGNAAQLIELSESPELLRQPPRTIISLAAMLFNDSQHEDQGLALLQRAQREYPDDFWINHTLGTCLRTRPDRNADCIGYLRAAVAIRPDSAGVMLNLGVAFLAQDRLEDAEAAFRKTIELEPAYWSAHSNLGIVLKAQGHLAEAAAEHRRAIEISPESAMAHLNFGGTLVEQGKLDEALAEYRLAMALDVSLREDPAVLVNLGEALAALGNVADAEEAYRQATILAPDWAPGFRYLGDLLSDQGNLSEAGEALRHAVELDPNYFRAHALLSRVLHKQGDSEAALQHLTMAADLTGSDPWRHYTVGYVAHQQQRADKALAAFRQAIQLKHDYIPPRTDLGVLLYDQGKVKEAIAEFRSAIEIGASIVANQDASHAARKKELAHAHRNLGITLYREARLDEAIAEFRQALQLHDDADIHNSLGLALSHQDNFDEAIAEFRLAAQIDPQCFDAHFNLALYLRVQGQVTEATRHARTAVELNPKDAEAHYQLGRLLHQQNKLDDSIVEFRRALELKHPHRDAQFRLSQALEQSGLLNEAIDCMQSLALSFPEDYDCLNRLGILLWRAKRGVEAEVAYRKCMELDPEKGAAPYNLAILYRENGDPTRALTLMDEMKKDFLPVRARALADLGRLKEAVACYRKLMRESTIKPFQVKPVRNNCARLSWRLATSADLKERDPEAAVELASYALKLGPPAGNATHYSYLGVAHFRAGDYPSALENLEKAEAMLLERKGMGDLARRMFLSMTYWKLGQHEQARNMYVEGAAWIAEQSGEIDQLLRFRAEAEQMLGMTAAQREQLLQKEIAPAEDVNDDNLPADLPGRPDG